MTGTGWCLVGSGGHARAVADVLARRGDTILCISDREGQWRLPVSQVVGEEADALAWALDAGAPVVVGIGDNRARLALSRTRRPGASPSPRSSPPPPRSAPRPSWVRVSW